MGSFEDTLVPTKMNEDIPERTCSCDTLELHYCWSLEKEPTIETVLMSEEGSIFDDDIKETDSALSPEIEPIINAELYYNHVDFRTGFSTHNGISHNSKSHQSVKYPTKGALHLMSS